MPLHVILLSNSIFILWKRNKEITINLIKKLVFKLRLIMFILLNGDSNDNYTINSFYRYRIMRIGCEIGKEKEKMTRSYWTVRAGEWTAVNKAAVTLYNCYNVRQQEVTCFICVMLHKA